jgi:hypothetical protein
MSLIFTLACGFFMNKFLIFLFLLAALQLNAAVKVEKVYLKKKFAGYLISNKFLKTVLITPNKLEANNYAVDVVRGGWFKSIALKNSGELLSQGTTPEGAIRYGLAQVFEPLVEIPKGQKELILPGVGRGTIDANASLKITEFFPWRSTITRLGENKENVMISFLQDCDNSKKELNYKMRIDCIFSETSLVEIKGVFFNLSDKTLKARVSPTAIFNNSNPGLKPWIVVPYQQSRTVNKKRISYIDCEPIYIKDFRNYYEFTNDRLSRAKRWVAVGGLQQQGVFAFISKAVLEKVVFWKTDDCFSIFPYVNLEAKPKKRIEWSWKLVVGRGMKTINNVTEKGLFGMTLKKYSRGKRYKCEMQFMPIKSSDGMVMDVLLRASRGHILSTKSYETFKVSPLSPETITMKLPRKVKANERYRLKVDMFEDDNSLLTMEQWIFPE